MCECKQRMRKLCSNANHICNSSHWDSSVLQLCRFFSLCHLSAQVNENDPSWGKEAARSITKMADESSWQRLHGGCYFREIIFFCFLEFPVGRESNWDVKHRSSSTLGLMDGNVFTVYLWPGLLEGRVQLPKGTNRDIYQFLTCSICSGWLLWLQPDPFKYHNYS